MAERSTSIRVLILGDRPEDVEPLIHELRQSDFEPKWLRVETESEYTTHLGWRPDVILADCNMLLLDAPRALESLRRHHLDTVPFIALSEASAENAAAALVEETASTVAPNSSAANRAPLRPPVVTSSTPTFAEPSKPCAPATSALVRS